MPSVSDAGLLLEHLLIQDADVFQTSLNLEDYLDSLAPLIRDALKQNALSAFIGKLNEIVDSKDKELNLLSLSSTKDINDCIDSIDEVSHESESLSQNLQQVNNVLNRSVLELITKKKALVKSNETLDKINETKTVLNMCILVFEITNKTLELIKLHRYFSALKLVEELTLLHLPKVRSFSFSVKIQDLVPHIARMIRQELFDEMCKMLSSHVERKIDAIGDAVHNNLYALQNAWDDMRQGRDKMYLAHRLNSPVEVAVRDAALAYNVFDDPELAIPLAPIYDCVLVYQSLNEMPFLTGAYHREWMKRYARIIYPISSSVADKLDFFQESVAHFGDLGHLAGYLRKIAAFFVVDRQLVTRTKFELRTSAAADDLWETFVVKLKPVLLDFLERREWGIGDLDALADLKDVVGDFLQVMENSGYRIGELYDILLKILRDYFGPALIQHFRGQFMKLIASDHYMPLVVADRKDYDNIMAMTWYKPDASFAPQNLKALPISFPFSEDYVHYCLGIRALVNDTMDFTFKYYGHDISEVNHIIVNDIFEKVLGDSPGVGICNDVKEFITRNATNKEIVAQSYTNLEYYLFSLYEIGKLLDRKLRVFNGVGIINIDASSTFKFKAIELFASVRKFSEDAIFNMVQTKVGDLLSTVEYHDWFPEEPNRDPNFFVLDFALFLENLFNSIFSNLPGSFKTIGLFRSFDEISQHFLNILKRAPGFNRIAIENFNMDVAHLEQLIARLAGSENEQETALQLTFDELRQTIDFLLSARNADFINSKLAFDQRFGRVHYETARELYTKLE